MKGRMDDVFVLSKRLGQEEIFELLSFKIFYPNISSRAESELTRGSIVDLEDRFLESSRLDV